VGSLPKEVWEDHLLPLLMCKEAARLACTCKALRGRVREHFKADLGKIKLRMLPAALTTFPRARSVELRYGLWDLGATQRDALVEWLRAGGHGAELTTVTTSAADYRADSTIVTALRSGALPSLKAVEVHLGDEIQRAALTQGLLRGMHELRLKVESPQELVPQLAALGLVRKLPALATLELRLNGAKGVNVQWPPFIPPSLKALVISTFGAGAFAGESLLRALPGVLGASGARLERLEVRIPFYFEGSGEGLVHVAQTLRCCPPTLKDFRLYTGSPNGLLFYGGEREDYADRRRVQWAGVLAGVSGFRELRVLVLPRIVVEPLFPPGTAFARLTHLDVSDHERAHPPGAGVMGLWELMASGGLPALATLTLRLVDEWAGVEEVRTRVAPALEAVAGTLTRLHVKCSVDDVNAGYELGVAVGKLQRLKDLALDLSQDGRLYHAFAQGLAASGGDRPLPLLWRVRVDSPVEANADLLASLLLPSVEVLVTSRFSGRAALFTACALRQVGYKHTWAIDGPLEEEGVARAIAGCRLGKMEVQKSFFSGVYRAYKLHALMPWPEG
jgi:hypothetical protein